MDLVFSYLYLKICIEWVQLVILIQYVGPRFQFNMVNED